MMDRAATPEVDAMELFEHVEAKATFITCRSTGTCAFSLMKEALGIDIFSKNGLLAGLSRLAAPGFSACLS